MVQRYGLVQDQLKKATSTIFANNRVSIYENQSVRKFKEYILNKHSVINQILTFFSFSKPGDTSNFSDYPDSDKLSPEVPKKDDPFLDW